MMLLTKENRKNLPSIAAQDGLGGEAIAYVKFFDPCGAWTWYVTEFDGKDTFFGLVVGDDTEYGYFSLAELESVKGPLGIGIERDRWFDPKALKDIVPDHFS